MNRALALTALLTLAGCAGAGRGGDEGPPIGHRARATHGAEPLAVPPGDVGNAEDPAAPPREPAADDQAE